MSNDASNQHLKEKRRVLAIKQYITSQFGTEKQKKLFLPLLQKLYKQIKTLICIIARYFNFLISKWYNDSTKSYTAVGNPDFVNMLKLYAAKLQHFTGRDW